MNSETGRTSVRLTLSVNGEGQLVDAGGDVVGRIVGFEMNPRAGLVDRISRIAPGKRFGMSKNRLTCRGRELDELVSVDVEFMARPDGGPGLAVVPFRISPG